MSGLRVRALETALFGKGDNLTDFILANVPGEMVHERMILAVTSKIVSLAEGRLVSRALTDKASLVRKEADIFLGEAGYGCMLTVKEGLFIPSAGIDESNSAGGDFILYPAEPFSAARLLWENLRDAWELEELGILLTDSRTFPLRWGVTGVCLSYWGFRAVKSMIGSEDLFGRPLQMTKINRADAFASAAVVTMGEGSERRPLALLSGMECEFTEHTDPSELRIEPKDDLYFPLFRGFEAELSRQQ
jgi:dihydrofolate synthase / folylpolyglutamate synthase